MSIGTAKDPIGKTSISLRKNMSLGQMVRHPNDPRLGPLGGEVVEALTAAIRERGFRDVYAPFVQSMPDGTYRILSGHIRIQAARKAGLDEISCWVAVGMSHEEANMLLVTANNQKELTPLELGLHALRTIAPSKGGRGNEAGYSKYARAVGKTPATLSELVKGAGVYEAVKAIGQPMDFAERAWHLVAIGGAPEEKWEALARRMLGEGWTVSQTRREVATLNAPQSPAALPGSSKLDPGEAQEASSCAAAQHRRREADRGGARGDRRETQRPDSRSTTQDAATDATRESGASSLAASGSEGPRAAGEGTGDAAFVVPNAIREAGECALGKAREAVQVFLRDLPDLSEGEALAVVCQCLPRLSVADMSRIAAALLDQFPQVEPEAHSAAGV